MQNAELTLNAFDYNPSKTANNAMTLSMAYEIRTSGAQVFTVTPGFTTTDLNGNDAGGKLKETDVIIIVGYATDGQHHNGGFWMRKAFLLDDPLSLIRGNLAVSITSKIFLCSKFSDI